MVLARALHSISAFYSRTFFERLILYLFLAFFANKVFIELIVGKWHFHTSREQQFFFFSFILLDYIVTWRQAYRIRIQPTYTSLFAIFFVFIALYGAAVGILNQNRPFEILNDTIPLIVMSVNLLRLQFEREQVGTYALSRLLRETTVLAVTICVIGAFAVAVGRPSTYALNGIPMAVYAAIFLAFLLSAHPQPKWTMAGFLVVLLFTLQDLNRTNMLFMALAVALILARTFLQTPPKAVAGIVVLATIAAAGLLALPEDSKTAQRIRAVVTAREATPKDAVGERETEYASIKTRLANEGKTVDTFGLGHGALYEMRAAHTYKTDYGHAHFSWALFKLRYGNLGYGLCVLIGAILLANVFLHASSREVVDAFIFIVAMASFIYLFTFANFIFLLSGLAFFSQRPVLRRPTQIKPALYRRHEVSI